MRDHKEVRAMLEKISKKRDDKQLKNLEKEVYAHAEAEEQCYYAPLRNKLKPLKSAIDTAHEEHNGVMNMLEKIHQIKDEKLWVQMFEIIKKCLESHMTLEEENIFELSNENFTSKELNEFGKDMNIKKKEFLEKFDKLK